LRLSRYLLPVFALLALTGATQASAASGGSGLATGTQPGTGTQPTTGTSTGGSSPAGNGGAGVGAPNTRASTPAQPIVQGAQAKIIHGVAYAPSYAPIQVQRLIWAGNAIRLKPYVYGGGHGVWNDIGYDCSGSVSYVLHAAGLLKTSMDSSEFESWGQSGSGQWITVYTNPAHAFIQVAGIRLDTSAESDPNPPPGSGPRWRPLMHSTAGFQSRHPASF
jgi:hypothetical protein